MKEILKVDKPSRVEITHQIMLGVRIAIGMFIVFPLFVFMLLAILALFGSNLG